MPKLFEIGPYVIYFWSNENEPLEPIHVHISAGRPTRNGTKIWITEQGGCIIANNNSHIPSHTLNDLVEIIQVSADLIMDAWIARFNEITFYC